MRNRKRNSRAFVLSCRRLPICRLGKGFLKLSVMLYFPKSRLNTTIPYSEGTLSSRSWDPTPQSMTSSYQMELVGLENLQLGLISLMVWLFFTWMVTFMALFHIFHVFQWVPIRLCVAFFFDPNPNHISPDLWYQWTPYRKSYVSISRKDQPLMIADCGQQACSL